MAETQLRIAEHAQRAMPKRVAFNVATLKSTTCPSDKDRVWIYDSRQPGLALMTTSKGAQSFYLYRKIDGRPERIRLGGFPDISIERARKLAAEKLGTIASGENPAEAKRRKRRDRAKAKKFGELFNWYLESHAKPNKRSWKDDEERYTLHVKPALEAIAIERITTDDIVAIHNRVKAEKSGPTANRVLALLSAVFRMARKRRQYNGPNPVTDIEWFTENKRERRLMPEEMPAFLDAVKAEPEQDWRDFFSLALWTAARSGNLKSMEWSEISFTLKTWHIPQAKAKAKEGIVVPLTAQALAILKRRQKEQQANPSRWVFPANSKSGHIEEPKKPWNALRERSGLKDLNLHDLRRSMGSFQSDENVSLHIIGQGLGHRSQATTERYARLQLNPVRDAFDKATRAMMTAGRKRTTKKKTG